MTAWQAERRRAQSSKFQSENARALANLIGAVGDAGDYVEGIDEKKRKREQDDADRELKSGMLRARTDEAKTDAEASLLRAKAAEASSQERMLRTKSDSEEKSARITREAAAAEEKARPQKIANAATDVESEISMPGGVSQAQLEQIAVERGLSAKDWRTVLNERDATVDKTNREAAEMANLSAQTEQRSAAAAKARRVPAPRATPAPRAGGATTAGPQPKQLTTGEAQAVIELQGAQDILAKLGEKKTTGGAGGSEIDTGPIEAAQDWIAARLGVESPEKTEFKALAGSQLAEYIKSISGATVSEPERIKLLENVPSPSDNDAAFMAKLKAVQTILETKLETLRRVYEASGRDTKVFERPTAPAAAAAPAAPVKVRVSNGQKMGEVAKADLGEFLAENPGWKVVR